MLNKIILIGRLTRDPEIKTTTSGVAIGSFNLAVSRNYTNANGEKETDFINCICFKKLAENVNRYVKKGSLISVEGRIQTRSYDKDGHKIYVTEIMCENVVFLDTKDKDNPKPQPDIKTQADKFFNDNPNVDISEDDLPF